MAERQTEHRNLSAVFQLKSPHLTLRFLKNREIKIHVYSKRLTLDSSWEFLRTENKQIKTVPNDSYR